ncbi:MAG: alpha/beta hydrolase [Actinobacteria bacterium]|nr:alpha/beta hydrolase [Actinomycetota bacterium]MDA2981409.1 alpha/beta hydrolase [Actinomycetota bacterium]MDA2996236.1 alpha/beta hydrolase [Actinomycetota bacterium]
MSIKYRPIFLALGIFFAIGVVIQLTNNDSKVWTIKDYKSQELNWRDCYDGFECSSFKVPIDYEKIDNQNFTLRALRHNALDQENKLGSIVVNPGGPGGSATSYAYNAEYILSKEINEKYDIVGFDPRGINKSGEIRCLTDDEEDDFLNADASDGRAGSIVALSVISKDFAEKCAKAAGSKLGHYSTLEAAKDMEILRILLNEKKLNFLGKSYGTYLGTLYAALYPESVGRMVLDGAVSPNVSMREQQLAQAVAFDRALNNFLATQKRFKLADIKRLLLEAETNPMKSSDGRFASESIAITAIATTLYDSGDGRRNLNKMLVQTITKRNPTEMFKQADTYNNRDSSGNYYSNQTDVSIIINCLDWEEPRTIEEMASNRGEFIKAAPIFGPYLYLAGLPCKYWKSEPQLPPVPLKNIDTTPVLVIGVTSDPATPYEWAQDLAKVFTNGKLLTLNGDGHTGHNQGNICIDSVVDSYFLTGKIGSKPLICAKSGT